MTDLTTQHKLALVEIGDLAPTAAAYIDTLDGLEITDDESFGAVGDLQKQLQLLDKKVRARKAVVRRPLADAVKEIDELFKPTLAKLAAGVDKCKSKLAEWARLQAQIAAEQARKERAEAEARAKADAEAADKLRQAGDADTAAAIEKTAAKRVEKAAKPAKPEVARGKTTSVVTVKTWKADVVSLRELCQAVADGKLPTAVIEPNMRALDELAREAKQARTENGVRFFEQISTQVK